MATAVETRPIKIQRGQDGMWRMWHPDNEYRHADRSECRDLGILVCFALERWPGIPIEIQNPQEKKSDDVE